MGTRDSKVIEVAHDGVARETDDAKLFRFAEGEIWIPKSQIEDEEKNSVSIPEWLALKKGLV